MPAAWCEGGRKGGVVAQQSFSTGGKVLIKRESLSPSLHCPPAFHGTFALGLHSHFIKKHVKTGPI
jgi:hypothetical protein